jgi:hypothetical protein
MTTDPGAVGLLWLWATVAALGTVGEPEHRAQATAETPGAAGACEAKAPLVITTVVGRGWR